MAQLSTPNNSFLTFKKYILRIDVPFLIRIDILQQFGLIIDFFTQHLPSCSQQWFIPFRFHHEQPNILQKHIPSSTFYANP